MVMGGIARLQTIAPLLCYSGISDDSDLDKPSNVIHGRDLAFAFGAKAGIRGYRQ